MDSSNRCMVCDEHGHAERKCPTLRDPLRSGFAGSNGYRDEDEEEDCCKKVERMVVIDRCQSHTYEINDDS
jgi:hypothetical protein